LEGLAESIESLNIEPKLPFFNPTIAVVSALILTGVAAFSYDYKLPMVILILSFMLVILTRSPLFLWTRIVLFILAWATLVSIPLPFMIPGESITNLSLNPIELKVGREGFYLMVTFISRVVAAAAIFTSFAFMMGWRKIVKGLEGLRVPQEITLLLNLLIIHIPLLIREVSKMMSAREARIMRNAGFKEKWIILATVVGDILLRSNERASRLEKGIRARSFASIEARRKDSSTEVVGKNLSLLSLSLCILASSVAGML
jgi:energy-coupling factor transporter transmembrane protein EcfT